MALPNPFQKHTEKLFDEAVANTSDSGASTIVDQLHETGGGSAVRFSIGQTPPGIEAEAFETAVTNRVYRSLPGRVPVAGYVTLEQGKPPQKTTGPPYLNQPKPQGSDIVYTPVA